MAENAFKADWPSFALGFNTGKSKGGSGGGAELNIAYGDTPPEDTTKLWVKTAEPSGVIVSSVRDIKAQNTTDGLPTIGKTAYYITTAVVGEKIYIFNSGDTDIRVFDPNTKQVDVLSATMPSGLTNYTPVSVGTKIYILGGYLNSRSVNTIYVLDTVEDKLELSTQTLPNPRYYLVATSVGNKIYTFGGMSGGATYDSCHVYDVEKNAWTTTVHASVINALCVTINGCIYFGGGSNSRTFWEYDIENNKITKYTDVLTESHQHFRAIPFNDCVIIWGSNSLDRGLFVYNTKTKDYYKIPNALICDHWRGGCGIVGDRVYLLGGTDVGTTTAYATSIISQLDLSVVELETGYVKIIPIMSKNIFPIISNDNIRIEVGVETAFVGDENKQHETVEVALYKGGEWVTI